MEDNGDSEASNYVTQMKNMNEASRKNKIIQLKWLKDYEWLCDEYKRRNEEMKKLCEEKKTSEMDVNVRREDRSVMPFPKTENGLYGWLAAKRDFKLEEHGSYIVKYPNPLDDVTLLSGNIPTLAGGKGLI